MYGGAKAIFSSRFAGSVGYYAAMLYYGTVAIDHTELYNKKNKSLHRMDIVGTNGCQMLSASLVKPNSAMAVGDVELSEHGNWRHNHWGALFSAYGRTPYFDYFADELHSIYFDLSITHIAAFNERLHRAVIDFLELPVETYYLNEKTAQNASNSLAGQKSDLIGSGIVDMSDGSRSWGNFKGGCGEYYQIWQSKFGFTPGLSILDLLFNEGKESIFTLRIV